MEQTIFDRFYSGAETPGDSERLNYDGYLYAARGCFTRMYATGNIYFDGSNILTGDGSSQTYTFPNGTGTIGVARTPNADTNVGAVKYNGTTRTPGNFYGGTQIPSNNSTTYRLNYDGRFYAYSGYFATVTTTGNIYFDGSNVLTGAGSSQTYTFPNGTGTVGVARAAGSANVGAVKYNGTAKLAANFYGGTTNPTSTNRLNYDGRFYATSGNFANTINAGTTITAGTHVTATQNVYFDGANILTGGGTGQTYTFPNISGTVGIARSSANNHVGAVKYNGHSKAIGNFYGGTQVPNQATRLNYDGHFYATKVFNPVWGDIAEFMEKDSDEAVPGDVLVQGENGLKPSEFRADPRVVGVYSDSFGYALSAKEQEKKYPVGLTGVIRVKVKEVLKIGDLLVSNKDGFATKAIESERTPGLILGKVLENKNSEKTSRIKMLIM